MCQATSTKGNESMLKSSARKVVAGVVLFAGIAGCSGGEAKESENAPEMSATPSSAEASPGDNREPETSGPITLTTADLDGFEKGLAREVELVRAASEKSRTATTPEERGEAIQAAFEDNTMKAAAPVTGLSAARYKLVRETLSTLLTTLDFQGKIDGPQSVDTANANAALKARLASDPYAAIDPAGAAEFKSRLNRIVPLWVQYVNMTAVAG